ncbi:MAG: STAS domain-containing protein [Solirubrobacteraceae bacterium]
MESPFNAHLEIEAEQVTVCLSGELDLATRPSLMTALDEAVSTGTPTVVVDMRGLSFIDSTGISALLRATHEGTQNGHQVQFLRSDGPVERTLRTAGVHALLPLAA